VCVWVLGVGYGFYRRVIFQVYRSSCIVVESAVSPVYPIVRPAAYDTPFLVRSLLTNFL
jgi:hypothetical protein